MSPLSNDHFEFTKFMIHLRVRSGKSARSVSLASGLSQSYVSKMEHGEFLPKVDAFARLMAELECSDTEIVFLIKCLAL